MEREREIEIEREGREVRKGGDGKLPLQEGDGKELELRLEAEDQPALVDEGGREWA